MHFNFGAPLFLGIAAFINLASAQTTNHWTVWLDVEDYPCKVEQVLGDLTAVPCGQPFNLGEVEYSFTTYTNPSLYNTAVGPTVLLDSAGLQIGACGTAEDYINCSGDTHDVRKHGVCEIVNTDEAD
ncbi:hypothetical protein F5Y16DRAFT_409029 [Xylariaceae sp. FL0255]|nr:hypothetical protein F5Y16DRAFT_409029 [Xylariaceae sp. FL0255]